MMPSTSRWFIAAAYGVPVTLFVLVLFVMPSGMGRLGGGAALALIVAAMVPFSACFLLVGIVTATAALGRTGVHFRWFDWLILAAAVAPLLLFAGEWVIHD